jgi:AAA15 family ATPase/GTPase
MKQASIVRLIESKIENFKNVKYGDIKYFNYSNANVRGIIKKSDINGIYGQNGSGKTAIIEALDILQKIMSGTSADYNEYAGMFSEKKSAKVTNIFFIENNGKQYKVKYVTVLKPDKDNKQIQIVSEELTYWQKGSSWKSERNIKFSNPFYSEDSILENKEASIESDSIKNILEIRFFKSIQNIAVMCAQKNISLFFNEYIEKHYNSLQQNEEEKIFSSIAKALLYFARVRFQVVKVNQLGANYSNTIIPMNVQLESENEIMQGCIPLFINGRGEFPDFIFEKMKDIEKAINIALKAIVPNLEIEIVKIAEEKNKEGIVMIQAEVYSNRDGKRFLVKYESDGIKRIISLLSYLISLYNNSGVCLVVDELDAGIFEYLLGEMIGVLSKEAKGQLIFTSHNLRIMEKLDKKNIICSTINPANRYISLKGIEKTHNRRDFYIRTLILGGQEEKLYEDVDLQDMGYAFRRAGSPNTKKTNLTALEEFMQNINDNDN